MVIIVIGVTGSGKSTLGRALAAELDWTFVEGDDFHPPENVDKMSRGLPLDDHDRAPWLERLAAVIADMAARGEDAVLACSALKTGYRRVLADAADGVRFVWLEGEPETLRERLRARLGHFMPANLLDSQLATLEPPADAVQVTVHAPVAAQVAAVRAALALPEGSP